MLSINEQILGSVVFKIQCGNCCEYVHFRKLDYCEEEGQRKTWNGVLIRVITTSLKKDLHPLDLDSTNAWNKRWDSCQGVNVKLLPSSWPFLINQSCSCLMNILPPLIQKPPNGIGTYRCYDQKDKITTIMINSNMRDPLNMEQDSLCSIMAKSSMMWRVKKRTSSNWRPPQKVWNWRKFEISDAMILS
jgi:hypothetical protein